ncbi:MAG: hypothetical protein WD060_14535 [Pirellulales bacterium]
MVEKKHFTEEQIAFVLGQAESGTSVAAAISSIAVNANSAGQAKSLVLAQYGVQIDALSVSRA